MILNSLDSISEAALQALIANAVPEGKTIDYKQALPGSTYAEKKEFLADVSSFANTAGGDPIFGIAALVVNFSAVCFPTSQNNRDFIAGIDERNLKRNTFNFSTWPHSQQRQTTPG